MKQVIDSKLYNTETATEVASWDNGHPSNDFNRLEETLYLTKKGAYFIMYFGGAATSYAENSGQYSTSSAGLRSITSYNAYKWLERHAKTEEILKHFPDEIEEA